MFEFCSPDYVLYFLYYLTIAHMAGAATAIVFTKPGTGSKLQIKACKACRTVDRNKDQ